MDISRRALLRGRFSQAGKPVLADKAHAAPQQTPPWFNANLAEADACLDCDACLKACPTSILEMGEHNLVQVNFHKGECEFCGQCADACPRNLFHATTLEQRNQTVPWQISAEIQDNCLSQLGIVCETCRDMCAYDAIQVTPRIGQPPAISVTTDLCSGCGACLAPCPNQAIAILPENLNHNACESNPATTEGTSV